MTAQSILIVEDSDDDYEVTQAALKKEGQIVNQIYRAENGKDALSFLRDPQNNRENDRPGIILLDLNLPGMDGRSVLMHIKSDPKLREIPVVVLTTSEDERDVKDCYEAGANTYICKPVSIDGFFTAIKCLKSYWLEIAVLPKDKS